MTVATMTSDSPHWVPGLASGSHLYFDARYQRWVVRAPLQVVFLDPLSLQVLRACDGRRNLSQIALCLEELDQRPDRAWLEVVRGIVRHFEARGILRCTLFEGHCCVTRGPQQSLAGRLLERRSSTK